MDQADFPWRPLGLLLVENGIVAATELELALAEQRRTGRLLGEILVNAGYVSSWRLAQALAEQHGVALQRRDGPERPAAPSTELGARPAEERPWQPLGRILLTKGFLGQGELEAALAEQARHTERPLGEILVAQGSLTGTELALALAEQHGLDLGSGSELDAGLETVTTSRTPGAPSYRVFEVRYDPAYQRGSLLFEHTNFLEAADYACDLAGRGTWGALEIEKRDGRKVETVWTYSASRAEAASRESLVDTFGYDPTRWDTRAQLDRL